MGAVFSYSGYPATIRERDDTFQSLMGAVFSYSRAPSLAIRATASFQSLMGAVFSYSPPAIRAESLMR